MELCKTYILPVAKKHSYFRIMFYIILEKFNLGEFQDKLPTCRSRNYH